MSQARFHPEAPVLVKAVTFLGRQGGELSTHDDNGPTVQSTFTLDIKPPSLYPPSHSIAVAYPLLTKDSFKLDFLSSNHEIHNEDVDNG